MVDVDGTVVCSRPAFMASRVVVSTSWHPCSGSNCVTATIVRERLQAVKWGGRILAGGGRKPARHGGLAPWNSLGCACRLANGADLRFGVHVGIMVAMMMRRIEVNPGDEYGDLTVIQEVESSGKRHFLCRCACGRESTTRLSHLRSGHSTSCGQCGIEFNGERKTLRQWAKGAGLKPSTLRARLKIMGMREALKR